MDADVDMEDVESQPAIDDSELGHYIGDDHGAAVDNPIADGHSRHQISPMRKRKRKTQVVRTVVVSSHCPRYSLSALESHQGLDAILRCIP